ncbi:unnamed protein product [Urochloa decumbens]|uniref:Pectinesterase inhibitor domain-containing protein n=1 Tax=Urochloa decumbens TaxID=240449 RepID=A0ABC9EVA3_9POAL
MVAATTTSSMVVLLGIMAAFLAATVAHGSVDVEHQGKPQYKTGDLVVNSCANVRPYDWTPLLPRRMCESTLRSDKHSATAKTELDLVLVAMDLLQSAAAKVDGVLRNNYSGSGSGRHGKSTALAVQYCRLDYAAVARTVPMCRAMVQELGNAAANCWGYVLVDNELAKAVSKEVGEVFQRATLVRAMIEVMIGFPDSNH